LNPLSLSGCGASGTATTQDYFAVLENDRSRPVLVFSAFASYPGVRLTGVWKVPGCSSAAQQLKTTTVSAGAHPYLWLRFAIIRCHDSDYVETFPVHVAFGTNHGDQT
jgi:hypothetical protein